MIGRAAMLATALLLTATAAAAQWRDGGRDGERDGGGYGAGYIRRFEAAQAYGGRYDADPGRGRYGGGGYRDRGGSRAYGGRERVGPGGAGGQGGGSYAPGGYGRPDAAYGSPYGSAGPRRGQVVPPAYRGAYVPDPGRYHLRAAPPGYGWVGDGRNAYLTQRSTGMVLDAVPGAYEPAPAWRRGGGGRGRGPR